MPGYGQFCPVAVACEVFAERWTPLILRELLAGSRRFSELRRGMPLISRALLAQRLRHLEDVGVIESRPLARGREYRLSQAGEEFHGVIEGLGAWGQRWIHGRATVQNLDAMLLMWNVRRRLDVDRLPDRRVVVRFNFRGVPKGRGPATCWLVVSRSEVDVCLTDPGFGVDLVVAAGDLFEHRLVGTERLAALVGDERVLVLLDQVDEQRTEPVEADDQPGQG